MHKPLRVAHGKGNQAQVLACGRGERAGVALVLTAEQALGVAFGGQELCRGNRLGVFFGLGKIDRNVNVPVRAFHRPFEVAADAVGADIVVCAAQVVKPVGRRLRRDAEQGVKPVDHRARRGGHTAHQLGVKQIAVHHGVAARQSFFHGNIQQVGKNFGKRTLFCGISAVVIVVRVQCRHQRIGGIRAVACVQNFLPARIIYQFPDQKAYILHTHSPEYYIIVIIITLPCGFVKGESGVFANFSKFSAAPPA